MLCNASKFNYTMQARRIARVNKIIHDFDFEQIYCVRCTPIIELA